MTSTTTDDADAPEEMEDYEEGHEEDLESVDRLLPFTIAEDSTQGHHGWNWKLLLGGVVVLSVVVLLIAAQFGGITVGMIDDAAAIPTITNSNMVHSLSRVWNATGNNYSWCVPPPRAEEDTNVVNGLIYVKVPKTASSTSAGVTLQISRDIGRTMLGDGKSCSNSFKHGEMFRKRKPPFLLWTTLREPSKRAISHFFHVKVSREGVTPSSENMIDYLRRKNNFQLKYISTAQIPSNLLVGVQDPLELIRRTVFEHYHFIAITERLAESLVVMKMLWGLSDADIIVMSAKRSGGYAGGTTATCTKLQLSFTTPEVDDYLRTNFTKDNHDFLLYAAANESLDRTIAALGSLRFAEELERHRGLQKIADDACLDEIDFPCSSNGTLQKELAARNCLWNDAGCGYACVKKLFQKPPSRRRST
jgi:hypothetical protein